MLRKMLDNKRRRDILDQARASNYEGSVLDLYAHASQGGDISQLLNPQQPMMTANTPEEQEVGLREQHAAGNTGASMTFPDVQPNTAFNTKGMKVPIDITKYDEQGHLVQSFKNVPPGVESLPTGPAKGTVVETPAYKKGGFKGKYQQGGAKEESHADKARRFRAMRPVKGEYYEGQADNSHSTHLGTYHSTGDTYTASPTITNKKAPYAGYHPQSFRQAMDAGEGIPFDTEKEAADFAGGDWKLPKYPRPKYQTGGAASSLPIKKFDAAYRNAYKNNDLVNMQNLDGEQTAIYPDLDAVDVVQDRNVRSAADVTEVSNFRQLADRGAEKIRLGQEVTAEEREAAEYLKKANPVEYNMRRGDDFSDGMETFANTVATAPLLMGSSAGNFLTKSLHAAGKYEVAGVKAGLKLLKSGKYGSGALKTVYHGSKAKALPFVLPTLLKTGVDAVQGKATKGDALNAASIGVNMYNPFSSISTAGKVGNWAVHESKDLIKSGLSAAKGKYLDAASYLGSTFIKNKNAKKAIKLGSKGIKEAINI